MPRPGKTEDDEGYEAPLLFADVKPSDSSQNRDGLFPFTIEAKFPVPEKEESEGKDAGRKSK